MPIIILKYDTSSAFNPEGDSYDYQTARASGMKPDPVTKHWSSREPKTGMLLKGKKHKTWNKLVAGEKKAGYRIFKMGSRYFSTPKKH